MDNNFQTECQDILLMGNCTKGNDCLTCNPLFPSSTIPNISFNINAKEFVPKFKKAEEEKVKLNLNAKEYVPKFTKEEDFNEDDYIGEEYERDEDDMIMHDILQNEEIEDFDDNESDDEKWFPQYKDCECCKGFAYKCGGSACVNLGACYCKVRAECDEEN